ncbi:MAG: hypothetical protein DRP93_07660 [Candidatus Neomarinimicrobiota bacterium]|nr:MAG: hypothetical protein DRP93_07660 [Candidatus Neomarinimicrobiota bacterium]
MLMLNEVIILVSYLVLTIIIEVTVTIIIGYKKKNFLLVVALGSVITNPVLNILISIYVFVTNKYIPLYLLVLLECMVAYVEFRILYFVFNKKYNKKELIIIAVIINSCSFLIGYFLREYILNFITSYLLIG